MGFKMVGDGKKAYESVIAAVENHGDEGATGFAEKLSKVLADGEEMPDLGQVFRLVARYLDAVGSEMVETAQTLSNELSDDNGFRDTRTGTMKSLGGLYQRLRDGCRGAYGLEPARKLGFEDRTEDEPTRLELQVKRLIDNFSDPALELPPLLPGATAVDPAELVTALSKEYQVLRDVRADVERERREAETAQLDKTQAMDVYKREFVDLSRWLEASFVVAGRPDLAKLVRPSANQPGRRQVDVDDEEETGEGSREVLDVAPTEPDPVDQDEASTDEASAQEA